jgi:hypothetical protein
MFEVNREEEEEERFMARIGHVMVHIEAGCTGGDWRHIPML